MIKAQRPDRRTDALSKERIVETAIEILDTAGENALTFRALAARLATGAGAIYWHVANKDGYWQRPRTPSSPRPSPT